MNSTSQSVNTADPHSHRLADVVGTAIAVLTLTLPLFFIAHYSSTSVPNNASSLTYNVGRSGK
ncbi:MAG: hypothetical protein QNJ47_05875 [Nostocaceae cyanobacterium]|nr:hypothetical protein [Nostocaceae cyanobacterium]